MPDQATQLTPEQIQLLLELQKRQEAGPGDIKVDFTAPPPGQDAGSEDALLRSLIESLSGAGGAAGAAGGRDPIQVDFGMPTDIGGPGLGGLVPPDLPPPGLTPPAPPSLGGLPPELRPELSGGPLVPPVPGVQDMISMFDPTTITGAPFEPPAQLPVQPGGFFPTGPAQAAPTPAPAASPLPPPPDSRLGAPPSDERGGYSGGRLRFPGLAEEAPGELPAAPEKAGDLSRGRATRELEMLMAAQQLGDQLGGMGVVTAGDVRYGTQKGRGIDRPQAGLGGMIDFRQKTLLGEKGQDDAMALQRLKGKQALEQIGAKDQQEIIGGLTEDQRSGMDDEARAWRTNVRIRKLQEASDAAQGLISMVEVPGTISHQMAARMLLAASGEERYSEQDIKGVIKSQGLAQGWWDYMIQKIPGKMSDRLKGEYTRVAREMKRIKDVGLHKIATDWSEGYSARSGIPASRISMEAYNIDPSKPPPSSPAGEEVYQILDTSTGVEHPATKEQWEEAKREPAGARFQAVPRNGAGGT